MGILADAVPWTVMLMGAALLITFVISISLGALMAYRDQSNLDYAATGLGIVTMSTPYYVFAILLLAFLGFQYELFPTRGRAPAGATAGLNLQFILGVAYHAALPLASMVLTSWGGRALSMRGNSMSVLGSDYLRVAKLRGLPERRIALRYVANNAILPMYTGFLISIGFMLGGSVILERIFTYHGVGYYIFEAISARDYPLMMGGFIVITIAVTIGILVADLTYGMLDPRADVKNASRETYGGPSSLSALSRRIRRAFRNRSADSESADSETDQRAMRDGGTSFTAVSDVEVTRRDRLNNQLKLLKTIVRTATDDWRTIVGFIVVSMFVLMGTVGVMVIPAPEPTGPLAQGPFESMQYPLGTNTLGMGLFAQVVHATPPMLKMIAAGAVAATVVATIVGIVSGYVGGVVDRVLMSIADIVLTVPGLPLFIVLATILEPRDPVVVGLLLSVNRWAGLSRALRSEVLTLREESYVEASRTMGIGTGNILFSDVLPNLMSFITIRFMGFSRGVIFSSVGLYFLGVLPFSSFNWGVMLNSAYGHGALRNPELLHWLLIPMIVIIMMSLGLVLLAQGLDRLFNPRIRARHSSGSDADEQESGSEPSTTALGR
jgi:ABC-type dipeptide/oligopeptide/nickel transport system permease subunit